MRAPSELPLKLIRVAGPEAPPIEVPHGLTFRVGRAMDCEICLPDPTVSRQHCTLSCRGGRWYLTDAGSRAGTLVNAVAVSANQPAPVESGDLVSIGPWLFRVVIGAAAPVSMHTIDDSSGPATYMETINEGQLAGMAQQRLSLLLDYASELNRAKSEAELAQVVLRCSVAGSGITRASLVRGIGGASDVEVIASMNVDPSNTGEFTVSRSLVNEAAAGRVARLNSRMVADVAVSIADMGIHSALAVPITVDGAVVSVLYMDARGGESRVRTDAADFCIALARLTGLAYANLKRAQLESRRTELETELNAAREAQELIVPESGKVGRLAYRISMKPGSFVAGDLFDVVALPEGRVAVCIGDVTGHGVGAGILMAAAQSHVNASLRHFLEPARAVAAANMYLCSHAASNRFVSLWVGVFDPAARTLTYVDAGHGHWMILDRGIRSNESVGGPPLGIDPDFIYPSETMAFDPGARLLLYSDGIVEQRSPAGQMFGKEQVYAVLSAATGPDTDPGIVIDAVMKHAGGAVLDDDATAAIIRWNE